MGLGINWTGAAAGYNAYKDERRRQEDEERRRVEDEAKKSDRAYQDEVRSRQRYEWSEADRIRDANKSQADKYWADPADTDASAASAGTPAAPAPASAAAPVAPAAPAAGSVAPEDGGPGTLPVADPAAAITPAPMATASKPPVPLADGLEGAPPQHAIAPDMTAAPAPAAPPAAAQDSVPAAPAVPALAGTASPAAEPALAAPAGIPKPRPMRSMLGMYESMLDASAKRGDVNPQAYLQTRELLNKMRTEGVTQAMDAFARGDFAGGMALYNGMGENRGRIIGTPQQSTTTLPNGMTVPTWKLTIANEDGSRGEIDTALNQFQTMALKDRIDAIDKAAKTRSEGAYHDALGQAATKNANTLAQSRLDEARNKEDANLVRLLTGGRGTSNAAKLDDKAFKEALDLNAHLFSYQGEDGKAIEVAPARSLYGNMLRRLDPEKAYHVMSALRAEAVREATDPKTGVMDQAAFLKSFNIKIAASDAAMRQAPAAAPAAPAAKGAAPKAGPGSGAAGAKPTPAPAAMPDNDTMNEHWVNEKLMGVFDGPSKYLQIARTHPNAEVRKAAQRLYDKAQAAASQDEPAVSNAL